MKSVLIAAMLLATVSPALACQPDEGKAYDPIPSADLAVAIATVEDMTITKSTEAESCVDVSYRRTELLFGDLEGTFRVSLCVKDGPLTEADLEEPPDAYGFSKGATVLVGVIRTGPGPADLRYAVPDCWGPYQLRLDGMSEAERNELLASTRDRLSGKPAE